MQTGRRLYQRGFHKRYATLSLCDGCVGKTSFFKCRQLLLPGGVFASSDLGFLAQNLYLPMLAPLLKHLFANRYTIFPMPVDIKGSLLHLQKLMAEGKFKPLIDREYPLEDIVAAYQYVAQGRKTGMLLSKWVIKGIRAVPF